MRNPIDGTSQGNDVPDRNRHGMTAKILLIMDAVYLLLLVVSWLPAIFSPMLAAGGNSSLVRLQVYSLTAFPFMLVAGIVLPWLLYALKLKRAAIIVLLIPLLNAFLILIVLVIPGSLH